MTFRKNPKEEEEKKMSDNIESRLRMIKGIAGMISTSETIDLNDMAAAAEAICDLAALVEAELISSEAK